MIGVTLGSMDMAATAAEAARRFIKHTGIDATVCLTKHKHNYVTKYALHSLFPKQTVIFFDADLWFVRDVDLSDLDGRDEFLGVKDPMMFHKSFMPNVDSERFGLDKDKYLNTGFMVWNRQHKHIWATAKELTDKHNVYDFREQSIINLALEEEGVERGFLDPRYNYCKGLLDEWNQQHAMIDDPYTLHAAGVPGPEKRAWLEKNLRELQLN